MKARRTLLMLVLLASVLSAGAQVVERTFYVDFGQNNVANQGYKTVGADKNGHYWNNIFGKGTAAPDKAYPQTISLVTSSNTTTDCSLQLSSRFSTNGYTNGGLQNPSSSLLGDLAIESATQDYIFLEGGQDYGVIHFKGLDQSKGYRFYMFGSRTATDTRAADFDLTGENTLSLLVPEFFGHGYLVIDDSIVSYKCGEVFYGEGDSGIMYNDPDLNIEWPFEAIGGEENLIISDKDRNLMSFQDYKAL